MEPKDLLATGRELPAAAWKKVNWRQGTKGPQRALFASPSVRATHGWKQGPQPVQVEEFALIEWPNGKPTPTRYWLARLPRKRVALAKLVATAKARWRVDLARRTAYDPLGRTQFLFSHFAYQSRYRLSRSTR